MIGSLGTIKISMPEWLSRCTCEFPWHINLKSAALILRREASLRPELPVVKLSTRGAVNCALIYSFNKGKPPDIFTHYQWAEYHISSYSTWKSYMEEHCIHRHAQECLITIEHVDHFSEKRPSAYIIKFPNRNIITLALKCMVNEANSLHDRYSDSQCVRSRRRHLDFFKNINK